MGETPEHAAEQERVDVGPSQGHRFDETASRPWGEWAQRASRLVRERRLGEEL